MAFKIWDKVKDVKRLWKAQDEDPSAALPKEEAGLLKKAKGMLPAMKKLMKDPGFVSRMRELQEMLEKDGVDPKDQAAVEAWMKSHQKELSERFSGGASSVQTVVRESPKVGRNDPCSCGSGKKFKKCCGRE